MADYIHEQLLDDACCRIVSHDDVQGGHYVSVAESNQWHTEQVTEKAALISIPERFGNEPRWIPKSVMGFSPSGDLYLQSWFYGKEF